jgi:hypothetical protein
MTTRHSLAVLVLCACVPAASGQDKKPAGKGIDADTVAAYQKLGGKYGGWYSGGPYYFFSAGSFPENAIPGFTFAAAPKDKLPVVAGPFGLRFDALTDAGLKDIAGHTNLILLYLYSTDVTDDGLKELAPLKDLRILAPGKRTTDAGLKAIAGLKNLESLYLEHTQVTDDGLKALAGMDKLISIVFDKAKVTDKTLRVLREAGLLHLLSQIRDRSGGRPKSLEGTGAVDFSGTQVTDAGLKELTCFPNVYAIVLQDTTVTGTGLKDLAPLKKLTFLDLRKTKVSDDALKDLALLEALDSVDLRDTSINDGGLKHLAAVKKLSVVSLNGPNITDASLKELANVKGLIAVYLYGGTMVTDAGVAELQKALPKCKVTGR